LEWHGLGASARHEEYDQERASETFHVGESADVVILACFGGVDGDDGRSRAVRAPSDLWQNLRMDRRHFVSLLAATSVVNPLFPGILWAQMQPVTKTVTLAMVR
jgi:hypothetical protein